MKLKLKAKIQKTSHLWDQDSSPSSDVVEGLGEFYTGYLQEDVEFNSAAEVYEYYNKNDWPHGWNDEIEEDYFNGGKFIKDKVKLIDHNGPKPRNYKVKFRLVKDIEDEGWSNADEEILEIEEVV